MSSPLRGGDGSGIHSKSCTTKRDGDLLRGIANRQTFSHLAFAFRVTPLLLLSGLGFALLMGLIGGVPLAIRAARQRIAIALREL